MFKVTAGHLIRLRRTLFGKSSPWVYGTIIRQDESGLIHYRTWKDKRLHTMASVDAGWMHDRGDLQTRPPNKERR